MDVFNIIDDNDSFTNSTHLIHGDTGNINIILNFFSYQSQDVF